MRNSDLDAALLNDRTQLIAKWIASGELIPFEKDRDGRDLLQRAISWDAVRTVSLLVARGDVDVNAVNRWGAAALTHAIRAGRVHFIRKLVDAGAEVNAKDMNGNTPLHHAMMSGNDREEELIPLLLSLGADPDQPNAAGESPRDSLVGEFNTNWKRFFPPRRRRRRPKGD